jgi:hypothetical protein
VLCCAGQTLISHSLELNHKALEWMAEARHQLSGGEPLFQLLDTYLKAQQQRVGVKIQQVDPMPWAEGHWEPGR